jgi:hypothetical protein
MAASDLLTIDLPAMAEHRQSLPPTTTAPAPVLKF